MTACAQVETELGRHGDARRRLLAALADAPPEGRAELAHELAATAFHEGRPEALPEWSGAAVRAAADAGDAVLLAGSESLDALGALWTADPQRAAARLDRATAELAALDDLLLAARPAVLFHVAVAQLLTERFADAAATSARAVGMLRRTGQRQVVPLHLTRAMALRNLLDLGGALGEIEAAEEVARLQRVPRLLFFALWVRAGAHHQRGEVAESERAADEAAHLLRGLEESHMTRTGACNLAAMRAERDPQRAIDEIVSAAGAGLEAADPTWRSWLFLQLVRAALATGAVEDADRWASAATVHTSALRLPAGEARAASARAEVLLARGDAAAAATLAEHAAVAAERASAHLDAADARVLAGRALTAADDTARAKLLLQRAAADAGRGGALRLRDAAARELRRLGTRVSAESSRAAVRGG